MTEPPTEQAREVANAIGDAVLRDIGVLESQEAGLELITEFGFALATWNNGGAHPWTTADCLAAGDSWDAAASKVAKDVMADWDYPVVWEREIRRYASGEKGANEREIEREILIHALYHQRVDALARVQA